MYRRLAWELLWANVVVALLLVALLVLGQLARIHSILTSIDELDVIIPILGNASLIMLEAVLPLAALFGAGIVFARMKREGALTTFESVGIRPAQLLIPLVMAGVLSACLAGWLAAGIVPSAVESLHGQLATAGAAVILEPGGQKFLGGGAVQRVESDDGDSELWAVLPGRSTEDFTLLRAEHAEVVWQQAGPVMRLDGAQMWTGDTVVSAGEAVLRLDGERLRRVLAMTGPPNSLDSHQLDIDNVHHRFTWHRRLSLPSMATVWSIWGSLCGALWGGPVGLIAGAMAVGVSYWVLRAGELRARAGHLSPVIAAWFPFLLMVLLNVACCLRLRRSLTLRGRLYSR